MDSKRVEKASKVPAKPFMAVGPTLHYSHKNVVRCWLFALVAYAIGCSFWSKIVTGAFWQFDIQNIFAPGCQYLGHLTVNGVSIFEYPWQILVLALLMGMMATIPVLISQLMRFRYSVAFIFILAFIANLPCFAVSVLISCIAAACRPLRFRSRFVAIALCLAPQLIYWGYYGGVRGVDPISWGFTFAPWISAWLIGLAAAGVVLGIGHFTRYRPGLTGAVEVILLLTAIGVFEMKIGFDELDYQLYVAGNNPEQAVEFHSHSITEALDRTITHPSVRVKKYLESSFYPTEPIQLRKKLKEKIQSQLAIGRWPNWFSIPPQLQYHAKKQWLLGRYDLFIGKRPTSRRMPIALYYKALLSEYRPDIKTLGQKEVLLFYSDYPFEGSQDIWYWLYTEFGDSAESIEARWRIGRVLAGEGKFSQAEALLKEALSMVTDYQQKMSSCNDQNGQQKSLLSPFHPPADSVITASGLNEINRRLNLSLSLISKQNRTNSKGSAERLAEFIMLNEHNINFEQKLNNILEHSKPRDGLIDNILLAQAKLTADEQLRAERLAQLQEKFVDTDGGVQAMYELCRLRIRLWNQSDEQSPEQKKKCLLQARAALTKFLELYPNNFLVDRVSKNLADLPKAE